MPVIDIDRARTDIERVAASRPDLELVVLFGSAARGRATVRSDVDVAVLSADGSDLDQLYLDLAPVFRSNRLDLVDLRHAGPVLAFAVARFGVVVFERSPGAFRRFQSLAHRRYADTRKLRQAQQRAVQVFIERGPGR